MIKWYTIDKLNPTGKSNFPVVFIVDNQEIEGWCIFNWDKRKLQLVQDNKGKWLHFKDEDIVKWRYYGISRTTDEA